MNKNRKVKFSVIIPTRERADTLGSSLQTCVSQEYDELEIIVSDNFSRDNTKEVVGSFKDSRIRYINTGKRLSMSDNWEFALSHVDSGYIFYLGDDDGLLPDSLNAVNQIIGQTGAEAVSCKEAVYFWPSHADEYLRNRLWVPVRTSLVKRNCGEVLSDVINFRRSHQELPMIYRSFIHYGAVKRAMEGSKRFFHSMMPDIYSGIALASVLESYYCSFKPFVVSGASRHSTAAIGVNPAEDSNAVKQYLGEENMPFHHKLVLSLSTPIAVAEAFLQAQDHIPSVGRFHIDMKKCIKAAIMESRRSSQNKYEATVEAVKKIAQLNRIDSYAAGIIKEYKKSAARVRKPVLGLNILKGQIVLDCSDFGVRNVYEAALLCGHVSVMGKARYYSLSGVIKTTLSLAQREILTMVNAD
jgi:glycosyltransferase involved in cell wall biosynthesis